jgi:uncharacterized protein YdcH (DUF465 family)
MPTDLEGLRDRLLQTNDEFRKLADKHHELDSRLHELAAKHYLSEPEQLEETTLKKRKLQIKDRMEDILRRHRTASGPAAAPSSSASPAS